MRPDVDSLVLVGRVMRAHGVRGELKIAPDTDDPSRLGALDRLYIGLTAERSRPFALKGVRYQEAKRGPIVLVYLEGVGTREDADRLRQQWVFVAESDLPPLDDDEWYWHDLIGMVVRTVEGTEVGALVEVLDLPAHEVLVVRKADGSDAFIPAVPAFIEAVNLDDRELVVRPIEGLLE